MGPKRTQYERCRKALNAFDLVYQQCGGNVNSAFTSAQLILENEFSVVQSDVVEARQRFEKARVRQSDLRRWAHDVLWNSTEQETLEALAQKASAELIRAEEVWNDI